MGIKERQERDREAVRRAILDAARELFVAEGYENVSIRKIAERIEYSPAAIYGYFPSKDDIFFALADEGFRLLADPAQIDFESLSHLEPLERIRRLFWYWYQFSRNHPQYFALMFVDRSVPRISREYERFAFVHEWKERLIDDIRGCVEAGSLPKTLDPAVAIRLLTMGLFGVAVMRISERLSQNEDSDALARNIVNVIIAGLQSGVALDLESVACRSGAVR